jgi:Histidinol-phosphate/aromatic aminotransferase and cobyric acid decarboxylase
MRRRDDLTSFEPYSWEPSTEEIARSVGLRPSRIVRMDTNVSPHAPVEVLEELAKRLPRLKVNQYPDTSYRELRELLADYTDWDQELIVPTNGADEGIDIISSAFLKAGLEAVSPVPTYSYFRVSTELQGARFVPVERDEDFGFTAERCWSAAAGTPRSSGSATRTTPRETPSTSGRSGGSARRRRRWWWSMRPTSSSPAGRP